MRSKRRQFYIPNVDFWHFDRLTDTFLDVQYKRCRESYDQTENALGILDEKANELAASIRSIGFPVPLTFHRSIEHDYAEIKAERKRIAGVQERLVEVMDKIHAEIKGRRRRFA